MRILFALLFLILGALVRAEPPRLILQITVDQLRGDLPERFLDGMGDGGFRYLYKKGLVYRDAHHGHANTETIVGHATLATGAHPAQHGMVGNVWFDRGLKRLVYNIEDADFPLLGERAGVDRATEIDPTQKAATVSGRSPRNILVSTFSDELALHSAGKAKIFGVSVKDRGAVSLAGHTGKAFWFSKASGEFVTSRYFYKKYPQWVSDWNAARHTDRYAGRAWSLFKDKGRYLYGDADDREWETDFPGFGRVFPHPYGSVDGRYYTTLLTVSPAGDELTLDFAKELVEEEGIGQDDVTDYLAISFSSTDYVGHLFGPSSLEMEDNLLRLDRTLARLFSFVDKKVGLKHTLIVLSADHGSPEAPGYLQSKGIPAQAVEPKTWDKSAAIARLKKRFGIGEELIQQFFQPYLYLNHEVITEKGLDLAEVQGAVAKELETFDGVAFAYTRSDIEQGRLPDTDVSRRVANNHNAVRSGDIYLVFAPHCFVADLDGLTVASCHGSPWAYDTYVPILFAGAGIKPARIHRRVQTVDVAPTLSAYMGAKPPSGSAGKVLVEVLGR